MPVIRWMFVQPDEFGDPRDTRVNTFHFSVPSFDSTIGDDIASTLDGAYEASRNIFGSRADFSEFHHKAYDLTNAEPRAPIYEALSSGMTTPGGGEMLPPEVSLTLSFEGAQVSGQPQARRRGRVYIGPCGVTGVEDGFPSVALIGLVRNIGDTLFDASEAAAGWTWVVFSPTNNNSVNVTNGWCDNAYDIQRRRGFLPDTRAVFPT